MKKIIYFILFKSLFALSISEIESEISKIQTLPDNERVAKMNELKMEIRKLNENEREKIVKSIISKRETHTKNFPKDRKEHLQLEKHIIDQKEKNENLFHQKIKLEHNFDKLNKQGNRK